MNETKPLTLIFSSEVHCFVVFLFVAFSSVAIFANGLVLLTVMRRRSLHTPINVLLSNLCVVNIIAGIAIYPFVFVINVRQFEVSERTERMLCAFTDGNSVFFICTGTALLILCAISFARYLTIKYPVGSKLRLSKRGAHIFNVLAWTFMVILLVPSILSFKHSSEVGACVRDWSPINNNGTIYRLVLIVLTFFLPITFLLLCYFALRRQIQKSAQNDDKNNPGIDLARNRSVRRSKKAGQVVLLLIINYLICWLPFLCYWTLMAVSDILEGKEAAIRQLQVVRIATLFTLLNCVLDPFLYMFGSKELRNEVKRELYRSLTTSRCLKSNRITAAASVRSNNSIYFED